MLHGGGTQRVAGERGHDGCIDALAAYVTYGHHPVADADLEDIVEVTPNLATVPAGRYAAATSRFGMAGGVGGISVCCNVRARAVARASESSARCFARSNSRSYSRRSLASNTAVRITIGAPCGSRSRTELTSIGNRDPSAQMMSNAISCAWPC